MAYTPTVYANGVAPAINATNLNHAENGLQAAAAVADAALAAPTPVTNGPVYWNGSAWVSAKIADAQIAAAAGIAYSKLNLATSIVNADVAAGAAIAYTKLSLAGSVVNADINASAAIAASKLASYPSDSTKFLRGDGTWAVPSGATTYRKTTSKTVNTTVAATDLLNAEITVAAGAMGTTGMLRLTAWGDGLDNIGANTAPPPRFQLVFGGTTIFDTGTGGTMTADATRRPWRIVVEIINLGAANSQASDWLSKAAINVTGATGNVFTTGEGYLMSQGGAGTTQLDGIAVNPATALDTSTSKTLVLNVINGSANAAYETKLFGAVVEIV